MTRAGSLGASGNRYQRELTPAPQLTLNYEPSVVDRAPTLRELVAQRIHLQAKLQKQIAADMDHSPSLLTKKLSGSTDNVFSCDDLEKYLASTGDVMAVIEYLAAKFAPGGDEARKARIMATAEAAAAMLTRAVAEMREGGG